MSPGDEGLEVELRLLFEAIYREYHHDFRGYAAASIGRRVELALGKLGCPTVAALRARILREPALFRELHSYLTVRVSDMFRDPSYFRSLREKVVPYLKTYPSLRIWVAGCSTGEEVYSIAIVLREEGLLDRSILYATDISPEALRAAEAGIYTLDRMARFAEDYRASGGCGSLVDHCTAGYGRVIFDKAFRRNMVFSDHSLATDGVFAEVQLVSCRNVLIYFDRGLQDRAFGLFREALCHHGFLGLGSRETVRFSAHAAAFKDFVREDHIYQRR